MNFPRTGAVIATLCLAGMLAVSWALWDSLPDPIITREATPGRAGVQVPRLLPAGAMPAVVVFMAAATAVSARVGRRAPAIVNTLFNLTPSRAGLNLVFGTVPPFLLVLHAGLLAVTAGYAVPVEQLMATALGLLLIALGRALPRVTPDLPGALAQEWKGAQRPGGLAMTLVGAACAVAAWILPPLPVAVAAAFMVAVVYLLMALITVARLR
ncbi:hypothetical protein [Nonomuraea sp. SBT364]|uniref:hypothetical protein n=1 Tax=Nonomuraea sp. SBT364 TaxID=1580530 RepID=UPI00066EC45C|nr:hypothetical protein [Nonomuraea sp. SBT364]